MRRGKRDRPERLEAACRRALTRGACAATSLESILNKGLERQPVPPPPDVIASPPHPNIRGPHYDTHEASGDPSCSRIPPSTHGRPCAARVWTQALVEPLQRPDIATLTFEERCGLLVDREGPEREHRRLTTRVRQAQLRQTAGIEALDDRHPRGLETSLIARLATCPWVRTRHHVFLTGPTGIGNTWLGCALGQHACGDGLTALDRRLPRFLHERPMAKGDGRYGKRLTALANTDVLMLDDWGLAPFREEHRRDVLAIVNDRHDRRATMITSQRPVEHWHDALGAPTLADAMLDRLVQKAYKSALHGESMRKRPAKLTRGAMSDYQ